MSVWFFGDSYCIESTAQDDTHWKYEHNWMDLVAQGLGADETIPISQFGVSNGAAPDLGFARVCFLTAALSPRSHS